MATRGRKPGSLMRCKCKLCGNVELRSGCTSGFICSVCRPGRPTLQDQAHHAVAVAIRGGKLPRPATMACADCGEPAVEYEHRDYTKPLEVEPICRRCNLLRGPAIGSHAGRRTTVYVTDGKSIRHAMALAWVIPA